MALGKTLVGFGFEIAASVVTPFGTLRPVSHNDAELEKRLELEAPGLSRGSILESASELDSNDRSGSKSWIQVPDIEDVRWQRVGLGVALASNSGQPRCFQPWLLVQYLPDGVSQVASSFRQFVKGPAFSPKELESVTAWISRAAQPKLSEISVSRSVSMLSRVGQTADSIVDAVIVWENLFGVGETHELSYRISMNMASMLGRTPADRIALQKEIKGLYDKRSQLVHGVKSLRPEELGQLRDRSKELTLTALRAMLGDSVGLLGASADTFTAHVLGASRS